MGLHILVSFKGEGRKAGKIIGYGIKTTLMGQGHQVHLRYFVKLPHSCNTASPISITDPAVFLIIIRTLKIVSTIKVITEIEIFQAIPKTRTVLVYRPKVI